MYEYAMSWQEFQDILHWIVRPLLRAQSCMTFQNAKARFYGHFKTDVKRVQNINRNSLKAKNSKKNLLTFPALLK